MSIEISPRRTNKCSFVADTFPLKTVVLYYLSVLVAENLNLKFVFKNVPPSTSSLQITGEKTRIER